MRQQRVEHHASPLILVEAEIQEIAQEAAGLRDTEADGTADRRMQSTEEWIRRRGVAAQERRDVAQRGKADAERGGIARGIGELVDRAGVEAVGPDDLDG